jgi:hypothetical protein
MIKLLGALVVALALASLASAVLGILAADQVSPASPPAHTAR